MNIIRRIFSFNKSSPQSQIEPSHEPTSSLSEETSSHTNSSDEELKESDPEMLRKVISAFLLKVTMAEKREMLHRTPLLLTPAAVSMCNEMGRDVQQQRPIFAQGMEYIATLLDKAREQGIDVAMDELEHIVETETSINLIPQWLGTSTHRDERQFLQHHPEMLTDALEGSLQGALGLIKQVETLTPQQQQEQLKTFYQRLYLICDIRARLTRLRDASPFSDDANLTNQSISEGYINWKGGFMLDLPVWLEASIKKSQELRREHTQLSQTALPRVTLWKAALKRAQHEALAPEIIAEIAQRIWDALDDTMESQPELQEEALAYLKMCVQSYTEERYPYQWAMIQNQLGSTYNDRIRGDKADNMEQAIAVLTASLRVVDADTLPFEWARTQSNLGHAYWNRIKGNKADNLEQAIVFCSAALTFLSEDAFPFEWAKVQNVLGAIYLTHVRGDISNNLELAITYFTAASRVYTEESHPFEWASIQNNLGNVYWNRVKGDKADNLEQAISHSSAALRVQTRDTVPFDWANTQLGLSNAYLLRVKGDRADNLEQAIACCTRALSILTEDNAPAPWATIHNNLGAAYATRIKGDRAYNLEQALVYCNAALRVFTEDAFPFEWGKAQTNLGVTYMSRIKGDKADNLEQAITCFTAAMHVHTEDAFPFQWAVAQNNLGLTYNERIKGDSTENIEQAIACLFAVSRVYTEKAFPFEWARTQSNLAVIYVYRIRGEKTDNLEQAIVRGTASLRVYTKESLPYEWARTHINLGGAYEERIKGDKANNLEQAIIHCNAALHVYTEKAFPYEWARIQDNLGVLYDERIKGDKADNLERSLASHNAALRVYTEKAFPFEWARTQYNLGAMYNSMKREDPDNLEQVLAHFSAALRVHTEQALPWFHRNTAVDYAAKFMEKHSWDEAHFVYRSISRAENILYALAASAKEQDTILVGGSNSSIYDAYALVHLGKLGEAAVTLEQGRARGLAAARVLNMADPLRIVDATRRADYMAKRDALRLSRAALQQPEERLVTVDGSMQDSEIPDSHAEQTTRYLALTNRFRQDQAAFHATIEVIRAADDPANFLDDPVTEALLLDVAQGMPAHHAIVSLVSTPWGGMALGTFTDHSDHDTLAYFATLNLPTLTNEVVNRLVWRMINNDRSKIVGGFLFTMEGSVFTLLDECWTDRQQPIWDGITPLQEWEQQDVPRRKQALNSATFIETATWLHEACQQEGIESTLDNVCQEILHNAIFHFIVAKPWNALTPEQRMRLRKAVSQAFLLREVEHVLSILSDVVMQPLAAWLGEKGVTSVTLVPYGYLTAFPILACEIGNGELFADVFSASVAPSLRSLVQDNHAQTSRNGVASLGNPFPIEHPLRYGQAEALTLAYLGGESERCHIQADATKAWLLQCLREAEIVDASCHGAAREDYLQSALYLADDSLSLGEALNEQIADLAGLRLLILSACQTAIPDVRGAENEVHSLAVGMLQAGVQAVMASLWSADDRATYLLIVRFAQEWFPNRHIEPPAAALARAQQWLRNVTWEELSHWQVSESLHRVFTTTPDTYLEAQFTASSTAIEHLVAIQSDETPFPTEKGEVSNHSVQRDKYRGLMDEGQENIRTFASPQARKNPLARPYAHPFYWAGFQINGW